MATSPFTPQPLAAIKARLKPGQRGKFDEAMAAFFVYTDGKMPTDPLADDPFYSASVALTPDAMGEVSPYELRVMFVAN